MSYLVLARKYRPQVFDDVVGQAHVTKTLANAITADRVAHAYLFCGPRGVGKTTAARILAKALNCEKGPLPVPCNSCGRCEEITAGRSLDVLEIDGASNRGINEVRELRENTRYVPTGGRFKVYIIDEVHMLTNEAFNALLKTLEEPPPHVVFMLATTEPFKVPATILSRCQRFDFARIPARAITAHLQKLMKAEGIDAAPEALSLVARRALGGLRDSLSLMDQIISAADGTIDRPAVEKILGLVGGDFYYALVDRLAEEDAGGALQLLDETYTRGADLGELSEGLAMHFRDLLFLKIDEGLTPVLEAPESEVPRLQAQAEKFERDVLVELVERAADTTVALRRSEHPRLTMELTLAEMARAAGSVPLGELTRRLLALEQRMGGAPPPESGTPPSKPARARKPAADPKPRPKETGSAQAMGEADQLWASCLAEIKEKSIRFWGNLATVEKVQMAGDGKLVLLPRGQNQVMADTLAEPECQEMLRETLTALGVSNPSVSLAGDEGAPESAAKPDAGPEEAKEPAREEGAEPGPDRRSMGELFKEEPMLQKALDMFDGEVLP